MVGTAAHDYARALLQSLRLDVDPPEVVPESPAAAWARSGAMALTGRADGPPVLCPVPLASCAEGALLALQALAPGARLAGLSGARLLGERAALAGLGREGDRSPGRACRLFATRDGVLALNLARDADRELLPAWLEQPAPHDDAELVRALRGRDTRELLERGRLLGLALAESRPPVPTCGWFQHTASAGVRRATPRRESPLVVDLSSLWAGPLCSHLLQLAGARVIRVESRSRPDGARRGPAAFHDLLNADKESLALDFSAAAHRAALRRLLLAADIVIEAARPRALAQLGLAAEQLLAESPALVWLSITGHGRTGPEADWIAFGDDAGVAAGLTWILQQTLGESLICGDAIADPLTGLHAAVAALAAWQSGRSGLYALSLREVVAHCVASGGVLTSAGLRERASAWRRELDADAVVAAAPVARIAPTSARPLGADTDRLLAEFALSI